MASADPYIDHHDLIERAIAFVCRRQVVAGHDAEDFASIVRIHLLENDRAVLRQFRGQSSIQTYLCVVVTRQFQDWRNARWGKFRASAAARRLGDVAVLLERLTIRDGRSLDEAIETLRTDHGVQESRATLEAWTAKFPARFKRWTVGDDELGEHPAVDNRPDAPLRREQATRTAGDLRRCLGRALATLDDDDRLIFCMHVADGFTVANIARTLKCDQKPLYPRIERVRVQLRTELVRMGVAESDVEEVLDQGGFDESPTKKSPSAESGDLVRLLKRGGSSPAMKERAE